jgi:hypothetical protein
MTTLHSHRIIKIKPVISTFNDFTVYSWIGVDYKGQEVTVEFFHHHSFESLVIEPVRNLNHTTPKQETEVYANEPSTL